MVIGVTFTGDTWLQARARRLGLRAHNPGRAAPNFATIRVAGQHRWNMGVVRAQW